MTFGGSDRVGARREAAQHRAASARRRAGLARVREVEALDPATAAQFAAEAETHERAAKLQDQAAESQRQHELGAHG